MPSLIKRYATFFVRYARPLRGRLALLGLLILGAIALQLLNPQIIRYFIDTALAAGSAGIQVQNLLWAAVIFLIAALCLQGLSVAATYVGEDVGWRATNQLRNDLALHCLHLDMTFHHDHTPGEMIERIDDILILDQGRIREYGPRARLAVDPNSCFAQLLQTGLEEVLV